MNKIDLASKPDAPLHYLRFRCSSRKCGDRIRKINVAPGLETVEISNVPLFYFFFPPHFCPRNFSKGTSPKWNGRPFGRWTTVYSNDIFKFIFYFQFSWLIYWKQAYYISIYLQIFILHLQERIFHILIHKHLRSMRFIIDISSKNLHIRPCQKETLIELLDGRNPFDSSSECAME